MSKPTKATKYIHAAANRFKASCTIDWNSSFSTVTMSTDGQDDIFMHGYDAQVFIDEIDKMTTRYPSLDDYTAACALAEPYAETIWN